METQAEQKKHTGVLKTIYERRAVRKYISKPVPKYLIEQVIDAGRMAPSAINKQPWKFYVLNDSETLKILSKEIMKAAAKRILHTGLKGILKTVKDSLHFANGMKFIEEDDPVFHGAPVAIFITGSKDNEWASLDIGMCAQNMMLAAKELGLESCPVGLAKFVEQTKSFPKLKIPGSEQVHLAVIIGYGDETPEIHERKTDNAIYIAPINFDHVDQDQDGE